MFNFFKKNKPSLPRETESMDYEELLSKGNELLRSGEHSLAIEYYKLADSKTQSTDFEKPITLFALANGYYFIKNKELALEFVTKAKASIPQALEDSLFLNLQHPAQANIDSLLSKLSNRSSTSNNPISGNNASGVLSGFGKPGDKETEKFYNLMRRVGDRLTASFNEFSFDITPQGNVLILNSDFITNAPNAITVLNIMLTNDDDWNIFSRMNFDFVILKGDEMFNLPVEQVRGLFERRTI